MNSGQAAGSSAPVVIVGAGPVGLSLALGLARQGVRSIVLEKNTTTSELSKAPGIQLRTLEIFRQWGVEERFLEAGDLRSKLTLHDTTAPHHPLASLDFSELDTEANRPGILILDQSRTERLLLDAVRESGMCDVRFEAEAVGLSPGSDGASVTVRESGVEHSVDAEFVAGCDGASSFVRPELGLSFEGITYSVRPVLADVRIEDRRDALPWPLVRNGRGGLAFALRLRPGLWRIVRLEVGEATSEEDVPDEEVKLYARDLLGDGPTEIVWASRFRIHRRSSPQFRVGRVLLAGDAAHIHSPAGGQGMNAGIQDAHNLAWKLAYALGGGDVDRLLDSYDVERRAVVVGSVSRYTDFITRVFLQVPSSVRAAAFLLWRFAQAVPSLRGAGLRRMTMIDLDYPASPLLDPGERCAGLRLPNPMLSSPDGASVRLNDLLPNGPAILDVAEERAFSESLPVAKVVRVGPGEHSEAAGLLRGLLGHRDGWILVRPDCHIAWARHSLYGMRDAVNHALGLGD